MDLVRHLLAQEEPEVQAVAVEGVAKLMLAGMVADQQVRVLCVHRLHRFCNHWFCCTFRQRRAITSRCGSALRTFCPCTVTLQRRISSAWHR